MAEIRSICVYCGSSSGNGPIYVEAARSFGAALARERIKLVYGGGGIGLMGALADAALTAGGEVTGIIPDFLVAREKALEGARAVIVTSDMHERKRTMFELADAFVALPGGIGTLEELVEQMTWIQLGQHRKPLLLLNLNGFWNPLQALLLHQQKEGFIRNSFQYLLADHVEQIIPLLREAARDIPEDELRNGRARAVAEEM
ncbi:MAG: TIGR00730 family Rossman fold protein [Bradyrhizobiaceae bacterium]|nr:TIGR00730 family Rossman fold protein [Bradyrhizobiaceae bacterium]